MRKTTRLITALLALVLVMSMAAACSSNNNAKGNSNEGKGNATSSPSNSPTENTGVDTSKAVKLKMILLGDTPTDVDLVYDELNKKLKEDINATVEVQFLSWADWSQKYPLILASGEDYDLIASANWSDYFKNARNGAFYEITKEDLEKYAPETVKNTPQEVLDSALIDGKLYNLPMNYKEVTIDGYIVRGDLMKKYGLTEIKSMDDFGTYLENVKKNEPEMIPWDIGANNENYLIRNIVYTSNNYYNRLAVQSGVQYVLKNEAGSEPQLNLDMPEYIDFLKKMKDWNEKGFWSKNALVNKTPTRDSFVNGKSAAFIDNILQASSTYTTLKQSQPEWELQFFPITTGPLVANPYINNGMAINARSENPDRALMLLDLLRNDQWYNQLTTYGIEGKHWELSADGKLVSQPDSAKYGPDAACPWGWRDSRFYLTPQDSFPTYEEVMKNAQDKAVKSNISSFALDKTVGNISAIEKAVGTLSEQYLKPLQLGLIKDVDKAVADLKVQVEKAGFGEYKAELQKQLEAYGPTYQ
ncbi:extracellular solute-binding protein [Paenibacillus sp. PL2-23]|uniref:extracellular solute-binding protein n=1 Tax=Paenibacillus sp. PL2-23 TaxID=2100729 RepID=UPI0030F9BEF4